jgi:tetratricopeptide (TPR) repeat protein
MMWPFKRKSPKSDWTYYFDEGAALTEQSRLKSAKAHFLQALESCSSPNDRGLILYNIGVLNWAKIGDGAESRQCFIEAVKEFGRAQVSGEKERQMTAFACDNLMYLSLSYDEYEQWADQTGRINPSNPILTGHAPQIRKLRDRGIPWPTTMRSMAEPLFNAAQPHQDLGKYGEAACIYHLMVINHQALRVSQDDWRYAVSWLTRLRIRLVTTAGRKLLGSGANVPVHEYGWIASDVQHWLEEYLNADPHDESMLTLQGQLREFLNRLR